MPKDEKISEKYERDLEVPINAAVKQKKLERSAECRDLMDAERVKMTAVTAVHREIIKELDAEEKRLRKDVAKSTETRKVKCVTVMKYKSHLVEVVRCDTRAIIESRPMTADELQEGLNLSPESAKVKGARKGLKSLQGGKASSKEPVIGEEKAPEDPPPPPTPN